MWPPLAAPYLDANSEVPPSSSQGTGLTNGAQAGFQISLAPLALVQGTRSQTWLQTAVGMAVLERRPGLMGQGNSVSALAFCRGP